MTARETRGGSTLNRVSAVWHGAAALTARNNPAVGHALEWRKRCCAWTAWGHRAGGPGHPSPGSVRGQEKGHPLWLSPTPRDALPS